MPDTKPKRRARGPFNKDGTRVVPPPAPKGNKFAVGNKGGGRPSLYRPEYAQMLIDDARKGYSLTAFCGLLLVSRSTLNEWMRDHPDFAEAVDLHRPARTRKLEIDMMKAKTAPEVMARKLMLMNAAPDEFREKQHHEVTATVTLGDLVAASMKQP